jgi:hypothetical protein
MHLFFIVSYFTRLLLQPIHRIAKTPEAFQWMVEWSIVRKHENYYRDNLRKMNNSSEELLLNSQDTQNMFSKKDDFKENSSDDEDFRIKFHKEVSLFYSKSIFSCRHSNALLQLNVRFGKNAKGGKIIDVPKSICNTLPKCLNEFKEFEEKECLCRLHSVCTLDPTIYPKLQNPVISVGGSLGIVFLFNPSSWGLKKN